MNIMDILYIPLGYAMKGCLWVAGNWYWIAIILFSLLMELVLLPLSIKQQKSSVKQAQLRPKEIAIKRKYKNKTDRESQQQMNMEIQQMYQQNGYNMFAGCLPLLIQLPIIMALYTIVRCPLQYTMFVSDEDMSAMYKNSVVLCETVKEGLQSEYAVLEAIEAPTDTEKDKMEFIKEKYAELTTYQQRMSDKYLVEEGTEDKDFPVCFFFFEGDEDIPKVAKKSVKSEYYVVSLTRHFDNYIREDLEEMGVCSSITEKSTEEILKEAYGYEKNPEIYDTLMKLPNYSFLGMSLLDIPKIVPFESISWLAVIPVLVFATSFLTAWLSRKLTPQTLDADGKPMKMPGGKMMEWGMPLMSAYFSLTFQAALGVYWVWRSIFSMGKQLLLAKIYPIPTFTEEEIKEAVKEVTKTKKKKKIVIEVDEDDHSYDKLKVSDEEASEVQKSAGTRKIKMLSADDVVLPEKKNKEETDEQ